MCNRIISIIPTRLFSTLWLSMQAMVASSPLVKNHSSLPAWQNGGLRASTFPRIFEGKFRPIESPGKGRGGRGRRKWPAGKKGLPNPRFLQKERGGPGKESRESSSSDLDGERKKERGDRLPKWTRKEFSAFGPKWEGEGGEEGSEAKQRGFLGRHLCWAMGMALDYFQSRQQFENPETSSRFDFKSGTHDILLQNSVSSQLF